MNIDISFAVAKFVKIILVDSSVSDSVYLNIETAKDHYNIDYNDHGTVTLIR